VSFAPLGNVFIIAIKHPDAIKEVKIMISAFLRFGKRYSHIHDWGLEMMI
jgi:hypothetical protein